jgi:hypothetical protein
MELCTRRSFARRPRIRRHGFHPAPGHTEDCMRHRPSSRHFITLGLTLALWGCGDSLAPRFELERARERWAARRPNAYAFVVIRSCFCLPESIGPVVVEVDDDGRVSRRFVDPQLAGSAPSETLFPTVEGLFAVVEEALARDAHRVEATYDARLGHPIQIDIDYDELAVDEEVSYIISDFTVR